MSRSAIMQVDAHTTPPEKRSAPVCSRFAQALGPSAPAAGAGHPPRSTSAHASSATAWDFARVSVRPAPTPVVQTKLVVGSASDPLEHEADAIADRVMRTSTASSAQPHVPAPSAAGASVQRKCHSCAVEDEDTQTPPRRAASPSAPTMAAPPIVHQVLRGHGSPLDASTRQFMETRFAHDFSHVRVHTDDTAAASARLLNARAYTVGNRIVFGGGQYTPATRTGRHLLAHELAHTVQQAHGGAALVQRAEVDDSRAWCKGLVDVESKVDAMVNARIDEARKAAPSGFEQDAKKRRDFLLDAKERLATMEHDASWLAGARRVETLFGSATLDGTKYSGAEGLSHRPRGLAAVINVGGECIGADKLGHFFAEGWSAFNAKDREAAELDSIDAEITGQGLGETGVFSNADITANLAGRAFYDALDKNPNMQFKIGKFLTAQWNEVNNPSYYTQDLGKVVWKNLLESNWTGIATFPGYQKALDVTFKHADMSKMTLEGDYREQTIPDGSDPWNQTLIMTGTFWGDIKLWSKEVKGASEKANAVYGLSMTLNLDMDAGPDRTGWFTSVGERQLTGAWSEDESGDADEKGTWVLNNP